MSTHHVLISHNPRDFDGPRVSYWNGTLRVWDGYDVATRYDVVPDDLPLPEAVGGRVEATPAHGVDLDGYPWTSDTAGPFRLTHCCAAATSTVDGPLYCKSCYHEVPWTYDNAPTLGPVVSRAAIGGPVTVDLSA